ncbi:MAG: phosphatase PAP2 family protein [Bacilli bacterium]|nr:phosphatase PAP2 family protein [Bacilli bacterium]
MKKRWYFLPAAMIVFTLFLVGTFLDLEISQALATDHLQNLFTKIFAFIACFPLAFMSAVTSGIIVKLLLKQYPIVWQRILLGVFSALCFAICVWLVGSNLTSYHAFCLDHPAWYLIGLLLAVPGFLLGYFAYQKITHPHLLRQIIFVMITLAFVAGAIEVMKMLAPRIRFTAVSQMEDGLKYYRPWWNPSLTSEEIQIVREWAKANPLLGGEEHKSFPSGHSAVAMASAFILMYLPLLINSQKLRRYQGVCFYAGFAYFLLCAFSRIYGGAHYLSDTMFAGLFALMVYFIANEIYLRKLE